MIAEVELTGNECIFFEDEIIVSKTDLKGKITYANEVFLKVAGYTEQEVLNQPHNMIRHPDMPRCIFKFLWDTLGGGNEIFAYVINKAKNGDHYWVLADVTPSYDSNGQACGYHSNRRVPDPAIVQEHIMPLYKALCAEEAKHTNIKEGMNASLQMVIDLLTEQNTTYDEFIFSLIRPKSNAA